MGVSRSSPTRHPFHLCSRGSIDSRIQIKCVCERVGQSTTILPEYCVSPGSSNQRHCKPRVIDVHKILNAYGVHQGCRCRVGEIASPVSITIEEEYVKHNVQEHGWYFKRDSDNTTIDDIGWTPGSDCLYPLSICA